MKVAAVVTAGGTGARFGGDLPKQFTSLSGTPIFIRSLAVFDRCSRIHEIVAVLPELYVAQLSDEMIARWKLRKISRVVVGGPTRQASVHNGLRAVSADTKLVAIHDAARCLVTAEIIVNTIDACEGWDGCIAALPVRDTLKRVEEMKIIKTEPRESLWAMQTPQAFRFPEVLQAYDRAARYSFHATDDAAVMERFGARIRVVEGSAENMKVTFPEDLRIAEALIARRSAS